MLGYKRLLKSAKYLKYLVRQYNVTVVGGSSELGQAVCLLLRREPSITTLIVHDTLPQIKRIYTDLTHIPMESTVTVYKGQKNLLKALSEADLVLATGGLDDQGTNNEDQIQANIEMIKLLSSTIGRIRPMPFVGIAMEPINMLVPLAAEIMKYSGDYDSKKLFGITGVNSLRAQVMYGELHNLDPRTCIVPTICGHSENTIVPLLSYAMPEREMDLRATRAFADNLRQMEEDIVIRKFGVSSNLSKAFSVLSFTRSIINAIEGKMTSTINAFVEDNYYGTSFFAGHVSVQQNGITDINRYLYISDFESNLLDLSINHLKEEVYSGKRIAETD